MAARHGAPSGGIGAERHQLVADHGDVVVAGREHDRGATLRLGDQKVEHDLAPVRVERRSGFVGEDHVGPAGEGSGDRDALALAAGQVLDELGMVVGEPERGQRVERALCDL